MSAADPPDWLADPAPDHVPPEIQARLAPRNENARRAPGEAFEVAGDDSRDAEHTPDSNEASRFLQALEPDPNAIWCFRSFGDREKVDGRNYSGTLSQCWPDLVRDNAEQRGVFVAVNAGGHKAADITRVRSLFVDLDGAPLESALAAVGAAVPGLDAGIIVDSSPGRWHCYWPVDAEHPLAIEQFRDLQKRLIHLTGADPSVHDLSRVMRLPGFLHWKGAPRMVRASALEHHRYPGPMLAKLPPVPVRPVEAPPAPPRAAASSAPPDQARRRLDALLVDLAQKVAQAPQGERNAQLFQRTASAAGARSDGHRLDSGVIERAMLSAAAACGLSHGEAVTTIRSGLQRGEAAPYELTDPARSRSENVMSTATPSRRRSGNAVMGTGRPRSFDRGPSCLPNSAQ